MAGNFPNQKKIIFPVCYYFYDTCAVYTQKERKKKGRKEGIKKERRERWEEKEKERKVKQSNNIRFNFGPILKRMELHHSLEHHIFHPWKKYIHLLPNFKVIANWQLLGTDLE